jgi:hypothetical protein
LINGEDREAIRMLLNVPDEELFTLYTYEYMQIANKLIFKTSKVLNTCMIHFVYTMNRFKDKVDLGIFKRHIESILQSYEQYFRKNGEEWDLQYAEKDIFERELLKLYSAYNYLGGSNEFWSNYSRYLFAYQ